MRRVGLRYALLLRLQRFSPVLLSSSTTLCRSMLSGSRSRSFCSHPGQQFCWLIIMYVTASMTWRGCTPGGGARTGIVAASTPLALLRVFAWLPAPSAPLILLSCVPPPSPPPPVGTTPP